MCRRATLKYCTFLSQVQEMMSSLASQPVDREGGENSHLRKVQGTSTRTAATHYAHFLWITLLAG